MYRSWQHVSPRREVGGLWTWWLKKGNWPISSQSLQTGSREHLKQSTKQTKKNLPYFPLSSSRLEIHVCNCCMYVHGPLCLICCNPIDCMPLGSSVHLIFQARILDWVTIPYSRGSSRLRDQNLVSCVSWGRFLTAALPGMPNLYRARLYQSNRSSFDKCLLCLIEGLGGRV